MKNYVCAAAITICLASAFSTLHAQTALPPGWPARLELGMADAPGGAAAMKATAPFAFRYQYLAGGVNTGSGWATWNSNGEFARYYIEDSLANGIVPVFTYYQMFQSLPGGGSESDAVYNNLNNVATMTAYYNDLKLFFQKAGAFPGRLVVLHVEPDLWGYIQNRFGDNATAVGAKVSETGLPISRACPTAFRGLRAPSSSCATPTRRTSPSAITSACGEPATTSSCRTRLTPLSILWAPAPRPSSPRSPQDSISPLPSSAIATPHSTRSSMAMAVSAGWTPPTSGASPGLWGASPPPPARRSSCGRFRSVIRRCARSTIRGATIRTTARSGSSTTRHARPHHLS